MIQIRRIEIILVALAFLSIGFAFGYLTGNPAMADKPAGHEQIAPCSLWASTQSPVLPNGYSTDRCVAEDGSISRG